MWLLNFTSDKPTHMFGQESQVLLLNFTYLQFDMTSQISCKKPVKQKPKQQNKVKKSQEINIVPQILNPSKQFSGEKRL